MACFGCRVASLAVYERLLLLDKQVETLSCKEEQAYAECIECAKGIQAECWITHNKRWCQLSERVDALIQERKALSANLTGPGAHTYSLQSSCLQP